MGLIYPKICLLFNKQLSLLDLKNLNHIKNTILTLVINSPDISTEDLKYKMKIEGFTVQIRNFMQSNYPKRLNYDLDELNEENISKIFKELLSLFNTNMI